MIYNDVCACIVTYHPSKEIVNLISNVETIIAGIIIVDNTPSDLSTNISKYISNKKVVLIQNKQNKGQAYALNQGLYYAYKNKYSYFLTLDQDSCCTTDMLEKLIHFLKVNSHIASVGPCWNNEVLRTNREVEYLITSGNLTRISPAIEVGGYDSNFFIDSVDMDFSLALRSHGYKLVKVRTAVLKHKIGKYEKSPLLKIPYLSHDAWRMYYIYRNHVFILKKYARLYPWFCLKMTFFLIKDTLKIFMLERNKRMKLRNALNGIRDGIEWSSKLKTLEKK